MTRAYKQGKFTPKNPSKYVGDSREIIYRSGWEARVMKWCDENPSVIRWASEELVIPYVSPIDNQVHRYFTDFVIEVQTKSGETKRYVVEVKPHAQTLPPKQKRNKQRLLEELSTYAVNQAKWSAAKEFCRKKNMEFIVITEKELF